MVFGVGKISAAPAPTITSSTTATGQVGVAFTYQITAKNNPTSFGATGLPGGLSVNTSTGAITGTPVTAGTTSVTIKATNANGTGTAVLTLTVNPAKPVITSATTATGQRTVAFSYQITATNSPTSYSASGLPAGLTVNTTSGLISGTPTTVGTSTVTLGATNAGGTGNATLTLTVTVPKPVITSATTKSGQVGVALSYQITASNTPTSFSATGLPAGLTINTGTGLVSGTPTSVGTIAATIGATNAGGTGTATLTFTIVPAPPVITSATTKTAQVGAAFSYQITATNSPTSYGATGLPAGLSVSSSTGAITGTPTATGSSNVTISASNAGGTGTATLAITITVQTPAITSPTTASGLTGVAFNYQITATNSPTSFGATGLPSGLAVNTATGAITGAPVAAAVSTVTLTATNAGGTATRTLTLTVGANQPPSVSVSSASTLVTNVNSAVQLFFDVTSAVSSIARVDIYRDGNLIGTATPPASGSIWAYTDTATQLPGAHTYLARAFDANGTSRDLPVVVTLLPVLPYTADFEPAEGYTVGSLNGQLGWTVGSGVAVVSNLDFAHGAQSVQLSPNSPPTVLTQTLAYEPSQTVEFFDFFAKPVASAPPQIGSKFTVEKSEFAFVLAAAGGVLQALNGDEAGSGNWVGTSFVIPVGTNNEAQSWVRLTVRLDFATQHWDLYANSRMVAADLSFTANSTYFSHFALQGAVSAGTTLDDFYAGSTNPLFADANANGIDDAWEVAHGLSLATNNRSLSPSGNGVSVLQAYIAGTDPNDFYNGVTPTLTLVSGNNQIALAGQYNAQPFKVVVKNSTGVGIANAPVNFTVVSGAGKIALSSGGVSTTVDLRTAADGTAQVYFVQPASPYSQSVVHVAAGNAGVNFSTMSTAVGDTDANRLPDAWENQYLGHLGNTATDDPGNVGRTLLESYQQSLNPWPSAPVSSGLRVWYRADLGVVKDAGNKVSQWADLSGSGFHVTQATASRQPVWSVSGLGSKPAVDFDGTSTVLKSSLADLQQGSDDLTVIAVLAPAATQLVGASPFDTGLEEYHGLGIEQRNAATNQYQLRWMGSAGSWYGHSERVVINASAGHGQVLAFVKNAGVQNAYLNGLLQGSEETGTAMLPTNSRIGIGAANTDQKYYHGQVAEILVYNRALSDTERAQVEAAIAARYGLNDIDGDGLNDAWEMKQLGTLSYTASDDPGSVGRTLLQSFQQSLSPWPAATVKTGLRAWYRADLGVTKDGTNRVGQWADLSGTGFHVVQPTTTRQPAWTAAGPGGFPAVQFDGIDTVLKSVMADVQQGSDDLTVIAVLAPSSTQQNGASPLDTGLEEYHGFGIEQDIAGTNQYHLRWMGTSGHWSGHNGGLMVNTVAGSGQVVSFVKGGLRQNAYRDGVLHGTDATEMAMLPTASRIGVGAANSDQKYYSGQIAEILVYNRALSDAERVQVEAAMISRYGLNDADGDGLSDAWELKQLGTLSYGPGDDPGGMGRTLLQSYQQSANVWPAAAIAEGLHAWYRADIGLVKDADGKVSRWTDLSGTGFHVVQPASARQPLWLAANVGGHPAVQFDGNMVLKSALAADVLGGNNDMTVVVVMRPKTTPFVFDRTDVLDMGLGGYWCYGLQGNSAHQYFTGWQDNTGNIRGGPIMNLTGDTVQIVATIKDGTNASAFVNGTFAGGSTVPAGMDRILGNLAIGNGVGMFFGFTGEVAEVRVYNRALSPTERDQLNAELVARYIDPDTDSDGLPDAWEDRYLGTRGYGAGADPGNVGRTLLQSYQQGLNPWPSAQVASGLRAWYRADLGIVKDAAEKVSQWTDLSGSGFHVVQRAQPVRQPIFRPAAINGQPSVAYDSTMVLSTPQLVDEQAGSNDMTVIVVMKPDVAQASVRSNVLDLGLGGYWGFGLQGNETNHFFTGWQDDTGNFPRGPEMELPGGTVHLVTTIKNGTSATAYKGGVLVGTETVPAAMGVVNYYLAVGNGSYPFYGFSGELAEILVYNRALSGGERAQVEAALKTRYGIGGGGSMLDSDGNGLADAWELQYFGHIGVDPDADPDEDGWTNLQEFQTGRNPTKGNELWYVPGAVNLRIYTPRAEPRYEE